MKLPRAMQRPLNVAAAVPSSAKRTIAGARRVSGRRADSERTALGGSWSQRSGRALVGVTAPCTALRQVGTLPYHNR